METRRLTYVLTGIGVAVVVVIGGLVAATQLGGSSESSNSPSQNSGNANSSSAPLPERVQGELRLFGGDPITLDPACASDVESATYIVEIFSGLIGFDKDLNIIPDIAEKWDVSSDKTVYTFHLRNNVLFHDSSRRVTAGDFKFSMERALKPDTLSTVGEVYLDDIVGAKDFANRKADAVSGIKVVDDNTLEITIAQPSAYFLNKLTYPTSYVVDQREVKNATCFKGAEWTLTPNGTGPFKMKSWVLGQRIELVPNQGYYLTPKPSVSQITYLLSGGSALTMYENNEIDITGVGINDIERIRDPNEPLNKELLDANTMDVFYIGFNAKKAPFDNPDVRKAMSMAIDRDLLANQILAGLAVPAKGILPPTMKGYNSGLKGITFDKTEAKRLLDQAGGTSVLNGVTLLSSGRGAAPGDVLDAIVAMWKENLGVDIQVEQQDFGLFLQTLNSHDFQMFSLGWVADYPDPQNFLDIKFHSQSKNNETQYSNADVDRLLDQARSELDEGKRIQLYQQAEQLIVDDSAWAPLYHGNAALLVKPYVKGYETPPFVIEHLRYVSIQK